MSGLGSASFGASPYGVGTPAVTYTTGGKALPITGYASATKRAPLGRWINPVSKTFEVDDYGQIIGMDAVQQQVYLALRTAKGSAIPEQLGNELLTIEDVNDEFPARFEAAIRSALSRLIALRLVDPLSIDISQFAQDGQFVRIRWRNLATLSEYTTEL